jgi:3-hydroxyacyl-CoA dehydrogenase
LHEFSFQKCAASGRDLSGWGNALWRPAEFDTVNVFINMRAKDVFEKFKGFTAIQRDGIYCPSVTMTRPNEAIALIGLGSIGMSFAALYLEHTNFSINVYDPRPDIKQHLESLLPAYLDSKNNEFQYLQLAKGGRLNTCSSLEDACRNAVIVQEQGPENITFKSSIWSQVISIAAPTTHLWSSTSGITASRQIEQLVDKTRLLVVHPFNPPHIMPLIELVPSPHTRPEEVDFARNFFQNLGSHHQPVVVRKELPGFVGNRLAFVLFREACHLVERGVVNVEDLDKIVENSIGPRWAAAGPFKSYNFGGGAGGIAAFMRNLAGTMQEVWDDAGTPSLRNTAFHPSRELDSVTSRGEAADDWAQKVIDQTQQSYGTPSPSQLVDRDNALRRITMQRAVESSPEVI